MNGQTSRGGFGKAQNEKSGGVLAPTGRADFRFGPLNGLLLVVIFIAGLVAHTLVYAVSLNAVFTAMGGALLLVVLLWWVQVWEGVVVACVATTLIIYVEMRPESGVLVATTIVALFLASTVQIAFQWERAVLLRVGKFRGLKGPGFFMIFPLLDKVAQYVDQRVRVTDFKAETTLTADTVPVNVDAIGFWMVWDPQKSVLEVEGYEEAVVLSAQTALRNAIGKNELAVLLSERERLGQEIQKVLDEKTNAWGITTLAVELRDIIIPEALEDAMSRQAQAERERQSRVILSTAETEIAERYAQASQHYQKNQVALHLRAMNMVYEGLRHRGAMIIVPSSAVETMGLGALGGLTAFGKMDDGGSDDQEGGGPGLADGPTAPPQDPTP